MKTKELIKLLQEFDPSGECHVRISGREGPVISVDEKEGYWDGPYSYLEKNEEGNWIWVESIKEHKVDIYTMEMFDFVERFKGDFNEVKKHIRFEYDGYDKVTQGQKKENFLKNVKEDCDEYNRILNEMRK